MARRALLRWRTSVLSSSTSALRESKSLAEKERSESKDPDVRLLLIECGRLSGVDRWIGVKMSRKLVEGESLGDCVLFFSESLGVCCGVSV